MIVLLFFGLMLLFQPKGREKMVSLLGLCLGVGLSVKATLGGRWLSLVLLITYLRGVMVLFLYFVAIGSGGLRYKKVFVCRFLAVALTSICGGTTFGIGVVDTASFTQFFSYSGGAMVFLAIRVLLLTLIISSSLLVGVKVIRYFR